MATQEMSLKPLLTVLLCLFLFDSGSSVQSYGSHPSKHHPSPYKKQPRPYSFNYEVKDKYAGTDYGQQEHSDGNTVKGSYSIQLPDGRRQNVNYKADHYNGFQADVSYYGEAQFPHKVGKPFTVKPHHGPSYHKPQPSYHQPKPIHKPQVSYHQPEPSYHQSQPIHHQPQNSYHQPEPSYHQPEPSYHQPEPSYHQPEPSYHQPEPSYHQPEPSYH